MNLKNIVNGNGDDNLLPKFNITKLDSLRKQKSSTYLLRLCAYQHRINYETLFSVHLRLTVNDQF